MNLPASSLPPGSLNARVRVLAPLGDVPPISEFLASATVPGDAPFSERRCGLAGALSSAILRDPELRADPASVALGYWMRPAAISAMRATFDARTAAERGAVRVPVGRVFHVAPANVDTLFVYSWVLAFLCGNASVVRVSRDPSAAVLALLRVFQETAREHPELAAANRFVTYEHDEQVTAALSAWCTHRILWGGNETVAALRPLPLSPHASERVFGTKFSYAVVSLERYRDAGTQDRDQLATAFFNDMFWFDQMACSSPQILFWVGPEEGWRDTVAEFEQRLQAAVDRRAYRPSASNSVHRLVHAFGVAADAEVRVDLGHTGFVGIRVADPRLLDRRICGGGLIRHARVSGLDEIEAFASDEDQTVTHFGFDRATLERLAARLGARGVDRIVPIGEALSFQAVWDGFDLIEDLTRRVTVQTAR